jgi:transposase-like protein
MLHVPQLSAERDAVLRTIRDARFRNGLYCVRCNSKAVIGWGSFSGRQRYKCHNCKRTFSDLTFTPAYYSKLITSWPRYAEAMRESVTIREAAARLDVFGSTVFRWRHAILDTLRAIERPKLGGTVEFAEVQFAFSQKGTRKLPAPRRRGRALLSSWTAPRILVVMACDRRDNAYAAICGRMFAVGTELRQAFLPNLESKSVVVTDRGGLSPYRQLASGVGGELRKVSFAQLNELNRVRDLARRYCSWLQRFRGVATKYVSNYLRWHRIVDANLPAATFLKWPLVRPCES